MKLRQRKYNGKCDNPRFQDPECSRIKPLFESLPIILEYDWTRNSAHHLRQQGGLNTFDYPCIFDNIHKIKWTFDL